MSAPVGDRYRLTTIPRIFSKITLGDPFVCPTGFERHPVQASHYTYNGLE